MGTREESPAERYGEIDLLRTAAIVCMVIYHTAFDLSFFFGSALDPRAGGWLMLQRFTANLFLLLVGVSFAVSAERMERKGMSEGAQFMKVAKRAFLLIACGILISLVTFLFVGDGWVRFGVLHLIGVSLFLLFLLRPLKEWTAVLALILLLLAPVLPSPESSSALLLAIGMPSPAFASVDYFPLVPWLAPMLFGYAFGDVLYGRGLLRWHAPKNRLLHLAAAPGRHALAVYLLHQPLLLTALWVIRS